MLPANKTEPQHKHQITQSPAARALYEWYFRAINIFAATAHAAEPDTLPSWASYKRVINT